MIARLRDYWHEFSGWVAETWHEGRRDGNGAQLVALVVMLPLLFLAAMIAALADVHE